METKSGMNVKLNMRGISSEVCQLDLSNTLFEFIYLWVI